MLKGSKLYSIFTGTCPVCQSENMYESSNPFNLSKATAMNERCSHCGTKYKIEPSFFYGAMYVSYGLGVAIAVASFIISYYFFSLDKLTSFFIILGALIFLMPINLRLSRNIWINFFMSYDPEKAK
ncbi:DUF983 domain-containing protein [Psychroflexus salis]|uniref:DUF983 domain-containing protein n=1 Tax=Psychroflexus salis TaxID=1526574 RepID=A0A916ZQD5_9FLAO|nr:DUF983 domain-containing protein [Psychroflexus salis]GGE08946.1 hypothetical protein GCM10010831_08150 [Psychroflexus salis]